MLNDTTAASQHTAQHYPNLEITILSGTAEERQEQAAQVLLQGIGEDIARDGLKDTPARMVKALREMTDGYGQTPAEILSRTFAQDDVDGSLCYQSDVILRGIEFTSLCEHHVLPFEGHVHIAYRPGEDRRIVGISKLARLVDCFARRLQVQERLTVQIAEAIETHLNAKAVAVVIEASHSCMRLRGCRKQQSAMMTCEVRGEYTWDKAEIMALLLPNR